MQLWLSPVFAFSCACALGLGCANQEPPAAPAAEVELPRPRDVEAVPPPIAAQPPPMEPYRDRAIVPPRDYSRDDRPADSLEPGDAAVGQAQAHQPRPLTTGSPPGAPASLRKPASFKGKASIDCPFPREADAAKIDQAAVQLIVSVDETGKATKVTLIADPGNGFGRAARECMMKREWLPGRDDAGLTIAANTPPIMVRFSR